MEMSQKILETILFNFRKYFCYIGYIFAFGEINIILSIHNNSNKIVTLWRNFWRLFLSGKHSLEALWEGYSLYLQRLSWHLMLEGARKLPRLCSYFRT